MSPIHPRAVDHPDGVETVSGFARAATTQAPHRRSSRRSRMAAEVSIESGAQHDRYEPEWRAPLPESPHAYLLVLRQRTPEASALLRGSLATAVALHTGDGAHAERERK